ncbi:hypothetical protein PIB30_007010 [Stylosanthes scabra]|uniref:Uncharacterized protein n=1 Tax=Stylosanthes scabra TaxID=79078 RepID=A0ABU6Z363_9FABA|nr:hypothetical protein [Stylosanthes scabra]
MRRPGPRHFDCVRRAWHSERHQPLRGTLIQEIFRVVDEIHGPATKNNKEYQEKLPIVVLKAEEILYSKANSQFEYMDFRTVLARTNEAIDTIIRRDEITESGNAKYLHPCIEAALNLGCSLTRTPRSQRNKPRCYLSHSKEQASNVIQHTPQNSNTRDNATKPCHVSKNVAPTTTTTTTSSNKKQCLSPQPPRLSSVYPLYYHGNNNIHLEESQHGSKASDKSNANNFVPPVTGVVQNLMANGDPVQTMSRANKCDLSLRLGLGPMNSTSF